MTLQIRESANLLLWNCIIFLKWKQIQVYAKYIEKANLFLKFLRIAIYNPI